MAGGDDDGMPDPRRAGRRPAPVRSDLPATFTPDTLRDMDLSTVRRLSRPNNGVLTESEQRDFDAAVRTVMQEPASRLRRSRQRVDPGRAEALDPELRRSYLRAQARLNAQAERARASFPQLSTELDDTTPDPSDRSDRPARSEPSTPTDEPDQAADGETDDTTLGTFEAEIEETSDTLVLLERIASIEQQQLEHHRAQALRDVRGLFFALVVSVAVIVSGVAPLVAADPRRRLLILAWTAIVCVIAGVVYAVVRAVQLRTTDAD